MWFNEVLPNLPPNSFVLRKHSSVYFCVVVSAKHVSHTSTKGLMGQRRAALSPSSFSSRKWDFTSSSGTAMTWAVGMGLEPNRNWGRTHRAKQCNVH